MLGERGLWFKKHFFDHATRGHGAESSHKSLDGAAGSVRSSDTYSGNSPRSSPMNADHLLERLDADGIENLWVVYHDYSGRSCAKTIPKEMFEAVAERGVVFAHANLSMRIDDHQPGDATFLADSGDFLAVPDPSTYARVPNQPATARVHVYMRADDLSPWQGCPRTRLGRILDAYAERGSSVRAGFEPEFFLFRIGEDGEYVPADHDGMYTVQGLDRHNALWRSVIDDLREMGITVEQLGKEYGPAQYEATTRYAEALRAVDNHLLFKDVVRARAREAGLVASFMPKPFEHLPGCGLHVHPWERRTYLEQP